MSKTPNTTLLDWLGLNRSPGYARSQKLGRVIGVLVVMVCLVLVSISVIGLVLLLGAFIGFGPFAGDGTGAAIRNIGLVLAAVFGAPFIAWRSMIAQKQVEVAEQGHITDRINKAVEGLGADKTVKRQRRRGNSRLAYAKGEDGKPDFTKPIMEEVSEPNIEVRIGAIYALERIAQDSDRDHVQIMEILCAYIRQNAPADSAVEWPTLETYDSEEYGREWLDSFLEQQKKLTKTLTCRTDIQTALSVIGRRTAHQRAFEAQAGHGEPGDVFVFDLPCPMADLHEDGNNAERLSAFHAELSEWQQKLRAYHGYQLDLRHSNLQGADLSRLNLSGALLDGTRMQGAKLSEAQVQGASLWGAQMQEADLNSAQMQGALLRGTQMQGAYLDRAQLHGAVLRGTQLQGAQLGQSQMQGANFLLTEMHGANLIETQMQGGLLGAVKMDRTTALSGTRLSAAALRYANLSDVPKVAEHVLGMFGDGTVLLPKDVDWPGHWPKHGLVNDFLDEWRKWQADPENYQPPVKEDQAAG